VESDATRPSLETMQKFAGAMQIPLYQLFYEGDKPKELKLPELRGVPMTAKERKQTTEIAKLFSQIKSDRHRKLARIMLRQFAGQRLSRLVSRGELNMDKFKLEIPQGSRCLHYPSSSQSTDEPVIYELDKPQLAVLFKGLSDRGKQVVLEIYLETLQSKIAESQKLLDVAKSNLIKVSDAYVSSVKCAITNLTWTS
jgi:hypothetical protein